MQAQRAYGYSRISPLDNTQIMARAPSVFTDIGHENTSSRYTNIPTIQIIEALRKENWIPVLAAQARSRRENGRLFAPHLIRFRNGNNIDIDPEVNDLVPEIVLLNSHDGKSSYKLDAGIFRFVCANGMVVGDSMIESQRVNHTGDILSNVVEGVYRIVDALPKAINQVDNFKSIEINTNQLVAYTDAAYDLKFDRDKESNQPTFAPRRLAVARRCSDRKSDLWTTFNRVQENIIKGGIRHIKKDEKGNRRNVSTRKVSSIKENNRLNKALWTLTSKMAELV